MVSLNDDQYQIHLQALHNHGQEFIETIFSLGNGHFGIRASNPLQGNQSDYEGHPGLLVNGFYDMSAINYGERYHAYASNNQTIVQLPDLRYVILDIDGERSDKVHFDMELVDKNLDMYSGVLVETFAITSPNGKVLNLTMRSFVSQSDQQFYGIEYTLIPMNFSGHVKVIKRHNYADQWIRREGDNDMRVAERELLINQRYLPAKWPTMLMSTQRSQLGLIISFAYIGKNKNVRQVSQDNIPGYEADLNLTQGQAEVLTFGYSIGLRNALLNFTNAQDELINEATKSLVDKSFETALDDSAAVMKKFWFDSDILINGDPVLQNGIRYNLFQLFQSAGRDGRTNIPAKGLSGTGYEGHYFWDTEMYMLPFFIYTEPEIARSLLQYRYSILGAAKRHAHEFALDKGAYFPWRTINGEEASAYFPAGSAQVHINADIASAVGLYDQITKDKQFLYDMGYEIILETARFWMAYGDYATSGDKAGKFVINEVTGPDEYTAMINNNYYTNRMAHHNLKLAVKYGDRLRRNGHEDVLRRLGVDQTELEEFDRAADHLYLPYDENLKVKMQDDSAFDKKIWPFDQVPHSNYPLLLHYHPMTLYRYQVNKQADTLMADYLFPFDQDQAQLKRDYDYYEAITTHDSSLSRAIFSILANRINESEKAYNYFMDTSLMDLTDLQGNSSDGIHAANMGGTWLGIIIGFCGMKIDHGRHYLRFDPRLPAQWNLVAFKIKYRGNQIEINVYHRKIVFTLLSGDPTEVKVGDQIVELKTGQPVEVPLEED